MALPLPCVPTAFLAPTLPSNAVFRRQWRKLQRRPRWLRGKAQRKLLRGRRWLLLWRRLP